MLEFLNFKMFFTPAKNLSAVFTCIAGVRACTKKRGANLSVLKTVLIVVPSSQNCLVNFCNLLSVTLETFLMKGHLLVRR